MVNLQPYDFQKKTNIKEHNDIVDKINEIVEVINASDLENVGTDITELEGKVATLENTTQSQAMEISNNANDISTLETDVAGIKSKDAEQDGKISTLEGTVSAQGATIGTLESTVSSQGTRIGTLETSQSSQDTKISTLESNQTSQGSKITALETSQGTQDNKITAIENIQDTLAVASTLSTTEHTDTEKIGISIDSQDGQTNKVAYIPIATPSSIGLMSATDKSNLDNLVSNPPVTEIPVATSTVLGGVKIGANLSITNDGVLSATGGGGSGADLPSHTVGSNDESVLVQVDPVITNGNVVLRTTYKDYKNDGTIQTKQDDSANFPTATTNGPGMMTTTDKTKLDSIPDASTIALKSEIPDTSRFVTKTEADADYQPKGSYLTTVPVAGNAIGGVKNGGNVVVDGTGNMNVVIPDVSQFITESEADSKYQPKGSYLTSVPIGGTSIGGVKNGGNVTINVDGTMNASGGSENYDFEIKSLNDLVALYNIGQFGITVIFRGMLMIAAIDNTECDVSDKKMIFCGSITSGWDNFPEASNIYETTTGHPKDTAKMIAFAEPIAWYSFDGIMCKPDAYTLLLLQTDGSLSQLSMNFSGNSRINPVRYLPSN